MHSAYCLLPLGACIILHQIACIQSNLKKRKIRKLGAEKGNLRKQEPGGWSKRYIFVSVQRISSGLIKCHMPLFWSSMIWSRMGLFVLHQIRHKRGMKVATSSLGSRAREETLAAKRVLTTNLHRFQMAPLQQLVVFLWPVLFTILQVVPLMI